MKHDLYSIIIEKLQEIYKINNENYLYRYLKMRTAVLLEKKKVNHIEMLKIALEDLNISVFTEDLIKGSKITYEGQDYYFLELNSEVMDNFQFRAEMYGNIEIKEDLDEVFRKGTSKSAKFRKSKYYKKMVNYNRLVYLNEKMKVKVSYSPGIEKFAKSETHNNMRRSLEETMEAEIQSLKHGENEGTATITERKLEDYVIKNLDKIEKGLQYIGRQILIEGAFIDILAKDKDGIVCILELKVKEDKSIIWQSTYYPKEIKEKYMLEKVRMITIAPEYSKPIYDSLSSLKNVEMIEYKIKVKAGEITEFKTKKARKKI